MSTWYSKHVEESNNIWRINNIQCITLVVLYDNSVYVTQYVPYVKYVSHTEFIKICQVVWPLYKQMKQDYITR